MFIDQAAIESFLQKGAVMHLKRGMLWQGILRLRSSFAGA